MTAFFARSPSDYEQEILYRSKHDPDKPPPAEHGDKCVVIGMLVGAFAGATVGVLLAIYLNFLTIFIDLSLGAIGGGILGTPIGDLIKKRRQNRNVRGRP